jgi:hypothetical protein
MAARFCLLIVLAFASGLAPGAEPSEPKTAFRVRPYLQNPAADAMTVRWCSQSSDAGTLTVDDRTLSSDPVLCNALDYQGAEVADQRYPSPPYLHSVRVTGLKPATSYPYTVEQNGEAIRAILTTSPRSGDVGKGGAVRLFFYADSGTQPESRENRVDWPSSTSLPGGPRPRWVRDQYLADETTGYRMNLALIASRAAESLRAGDPVLASVVGDLVANGGEQRDWDEFWRHNAGMFGSLGSRVPIVAALGDNEMCGGPSSTDLLTDLGGYSGPASLIGSRKFLTYFEHPDNGAADARHVGRYHRIDFGPITLLTLDSTNGGSDGTDSDTNQLLGRSKAMHIPDYSEGSEQYMWLERELGEAQARGAITFVQFHHPPFSAGPHGQAPGKGAGQDEHSGQPMRILAPLLRTHGVRAVFSGHDGMYEHSIVEGVHYYDVGIGGDSLRGPQEGVVNDRQIFLAHDHAPEHWNENVLEQGGKHYGHIEVDVRRKDPTKGNVDAANAPPAEFVVTITPVYVFPVLDPEKPGEIVTWERREYDDPLTFDAGGGKSPPAASSTPSPQESVP